MANLDAIVQQLKRERGQAAKAVQQLDAALSALGGSSSGVSQKRGNRLSAAARARIAAAQRARWAKVRSSSGQKRSPAQKQNVVSISKKRPTLSAAARKKIAAAQRARWAKVRAAQKKSA
jgi:hypothetical protein